MKIGILCAGDREAAPFFTLIHDAQIEHKAMLTIYSGRLGRTPVAVLYSGVCKVNAAIAAQLLITGFGCTHIINAGTGGALAADVDVFDTVVAEEACYHDVAPHILTGFHPWLKEAVFPSDATLLKAARMAAEHPDFAGRTHFGRMITGETFVDGLLRERLIADFAPLCADMETAAVAHVCHAFGIPFVAVRTMTDRADSHASDAFEKHVDEAAMRTVRFVQHLCDALERSEIHGI